MEVKSKEINNKSTHWLRPSLYRILSYGICKFTYRSFSRVDIVSI